MKRFKFRLQTLLDQRKAREEDLMRELGILQNEERQEIDKLQNLKDISAQAFNEMSARLESDSLDVQELSRMDSYARRTVEDICVQELTIEAVKKRVEAKRNEVVEAMKERKVLEALKDKQELAHKSAEMLAEQNMLDEISSVRYARGI